jgi:hypothetical protein
MFELTSVNEMAVTKDSMFMIRCDMCQYTAGVPSGRREHSYRFQSLTANHLTICPKIPIKLKQQVLSERDKLPPYLV